MNNTVLNQLYSLIIYLASGIIIGILFDIFRILRKSFKTADIITYAEDILFWILTGAFLIFILFTFSNGEIRLYNFVGMITGILLYVLLFSKKFIKINVAILNFLKIIIYKIVNILLFPIKLVCKCIKKIINPFTFFVINLKKHTKNIKKVKIKEGF